MGGNGGPTDCSQMGWQQQGQRDLSPEERPQLRFPWQHPRPASVPQVTVSVPAAVGVPSAQHSGVIQTLVPLCKASRTGPPALPKRP